MTTTTIKQQLIDGTTSHFYVFTGDELEVQRVYINRIAEVKNQVVRRIDSVAEALKAKGLGMIGKSFCFVCREDADFQKNDEAWDKVEALLKDNTLIYQVTKLDKRSKFYDTLKDRVVSFDYMSEPILIKHIREHINLSVDNCKKLIQVCESDYGRILNEVDKILEYGAGVQTVPVDTLETSRYDSFFSTLMNDGAIYQPPEDAIFKWVDAMLSGKPCLAFKLFQECLDIGEPSLRLLFVLYQGVRRLLQVQSCESKDVAKTTGLTQWEINLVKDKVGIYRTGELVEALRNIKSLETAIKIGEVEDEYTVPYAMISLLSA